MSEAIAIKNLVALATSRTTKGNYHLSRYEEKSGKIVWNRSKETQTELCNFTAKIIEEVVQDDGAERKMVFIIKGQSCDGRLLLTIEVPSEKYACMSWINSSWGTQAIVYAGTTTKDHLRVAILTLSGAVKRRTIFTHLGWRYVSDKWVYLHAGGIIGDKECDEAPVSSQRGRLNSYLLSKPIDESDLKNAIKDSLLFLEIAPLKLSAPLMSAIFRAPLGECLGIDFSIFLSGSSGCQKSELSAIAQAYFGKEFKRTSLPGNWSSTGNALERQAFLAKDALFVVDDFAPSGSGIDVAKLHKEADRLLRGQGNQSGRDRLSADLYVRPQYYSRGLIISSGEDIPRGTSVRARMCILEVCRGDVNLAILTSMQQAAEIGQLSKSMAGYIEWLAPQIDMLKKTFPEQLRAMRSEVTLTASHARTPDLIISLGLGLRCFLQFAEEKGALTKESSIETWGRCWTALLEAGNAQSDHHHVEDSETKFLELLNAALSSGRAYLADAKTGTRPPESGQWGWRPEGTVIRSPDGEPEVDRWVCKGDKIGWIDRGEILLNPDAAFACVQVIAKNQNDLIPTSKNVLWKRLVQKGYARKGEKGKNLNKRTVEGARMRVLVLANMELLSSLESGGNGDNGGQAPEVVNPAPQ